MLESSEDGQSRIEPALPTKEEEQDSPDVLTEEYTLKEDQLESG